MPSFAKPLKPTKVKASDLPTYAPFEVQKSAADEMEETKELSRAQLLVRDNKAKLEKREYRRRATVEVDQSLLETPIELGSDIWIPDSEKVWKKVEIVDFDAEKKLLNVRRVGSTDEGIIIVDLREIGDIYKVNPRTVNDMTSLYYIHEAGILENLRLRADMNNMRPYTYMANVLIATNPLVRLVEPKIADYIKTSMGDKPPHPYAIAEVGFQQMALRTPSQCQSIVISGESGAGKTETSKIVLRYLTSREHVWMSELNETAGKWDGTSTELDQRLLDTNPILEAFGNAKTLRNHNSSRFGKFMKLQFSDDGNHKLVGASIETYLLEKSRLVFQIPGERNFHIFYFLLKGANAARLSALKLTSPKDYYYLNQSGCTTDVNVDDDVLYDEVVIALESVGITAEEQDEIFQVLAGLLHLGNIKLENRETAEGDAAEIITPTALDAAGEFLGISVDLFKKTICTREITTRGEVFKIVRNAKEGQYVRDAVAKSIYQHLFAWIVHTINVALGHGPASLPYIGVLDIFGFESFKYNDFEQLLINYANEALQATFNQQVFITEQELFDSEGIEVGKIIWPDNRECIDLISGKPNGILPLLDTEARLPKPSDEKWNVTLHKTHSGNAHFLPPHAKDKKFVFVVKHFATKVEYHIGNFVDKNNDTIPKDLLQFVMSSSSRVIKSMFAMSDEVTDNGGNKTSAVSVSIKFSTQMKTLINTLNGTRCNFIRCVKPNPSMTPGVFDNGYVVDQLRCTGMLATCELLKVGLPTRVSYAEICSIYKPVLPANVTPMFAPYTDRTFTEAVLWSFRVEEDAYRLGRTKVFFKTGKIALLDALLKVDMDKMGPWIVGRLRKWLARRRWRYATAKILGQRGFIWLLQYIRRKKKAVLTLQSVARMYNVRKKFVVKLSAHRIQQRKKMMAHRRWKMAIGTVRAFKAWEGILGNTRAKFAAERKRLEAERALQLVSATCIQRIVRGKLGRKKADFARAQAEEAALRARLENEQAEAAAAASKRVRRKWKGAFYAIQAQNHFLKRYQGIHQARVMAEEARLKALEEARQLEENALRLKAEADAAENALAKAKEEEAAIKIQALYRGYQGRQDAIRYAAVATAQAAAIAAAKAAEEAEAAAEAANAAERAEARLREPAGYAVAGSVGALGEVVRSLSGMESSGQLDKQANLQEADLSWMGEESKVEGEGVVGHGEKDEELAQAGRDLFGEGGEEPSGPLMEAEEENIVNPVEARQDFPVGPPIPYKGGIFSCTMLGHRKQQDQNWGDEYTEYVLRCTWGRDILEQSKTAWLVGGRYNDFNALHQELKAAASGRRGKRAPWFPRFPKRHPFSSMMGKNQEENFIHKREKELNRYMTQVLTQMPDALLNIHMDRFMNLSLRTQDICEREAYMEARKRWEEEEREALANAADAEPLNKEELSEVEQLVQQLLEKIIYAQSDVRQDTQLQEMIHAVKVLQPRVAASSQIGAGVDMELVPLAMQLQDDIQDAFNQYNDTLLALRINQSA